MLTKKDFIEAAGHIRAAYAECEGDEVMLRLCRQLEDNLAKYFANDNPRFDEARFRNACNPREMRT